MNRIYKILATGFLALMLFLNIGLTLSINMGLHAHFLGDNRILIHLHNTQGGEHSHNNPDCGNSSNFVFSTTITYLNDNKNISFKDTCKLLESHSKIALQESYHSYCYFHSPWRAPPVA